MQELNWAAALALPLLCGACLLGQPTDGEDAGAAPDAATGPCGSNPRICNDGHCTRSDGCCSDSECATSPAGPHCLADDLGGACGCYLTTGAVRQATACSIGSVCTRVGECHCPAGQCNGVCSSTLGCCFDNDCLATDGVPSICQNNHCSCAGFKACNGWCVPDIAGACCVNADCPAGRHCGAGVCWPGS